MLEQVKYGVLLDLQDQMRNQDGRGDAFPSDSLSKMLEDAERMVKEMQNRDFNTPKIAAETERDEAKKRKKHSLNLSERMQFKRTKKKYLLSLLFSLRLCQE